MDRMLPDDEMIMRLAQRVEEIGEALAQAEIEYSPFTALAMAEFAVHVAADTMKLPRHEARIRLIGALTEMFRADIELLLQERGEDGRDGGARVGRDGA